MGGGSTTAKTASYVLVAADAGTVVQMNSASATTITVNTALFAAGDTVEIQNVGAGVCTVTAGTATVNTSSTLALKQYDAGSLYFNSTSAAIFFATDAADSTSPLTTKGDLYGFSTVDARIPIGTNNQVLTADSAQALGLKWATPTAASPTFVGCSIYNSATFTLANNTMTRITMNSEFFDTNGFHDNTTNNARVTIPVGYGGYYLVSTAGKWETSATGYRAVELYKNNTSLIAMIQIPGNSTINAYDRASIIINVAVGDYLELFAYQNSGGNLSGYFREYEYPLQVEYLGA